ncbi:MAG: ABC transporter substrate-binding protein, partial [Candidatus Thermoplasmatota archaeon]
MASFIVCLVALLVLSGIPGLSAAYTPNPGTRQAELILKVGGQDEMKTNNLLPAIANDVWTSDVHYRAYSGILLGHPVLDQPMAYIAKGVDYDEDDTFEPSEYDTWKEQPAPREPLNITVYYDFNGVKWHDGVQMTQWDFFFSYHMNAMNPRFNTDLRILFEGGTGATYEAGGRKLNIGLVTKNWQGEGAMQGDPNLRVAVKFRLTESFALFYDSSLSPVMLPLHEWSLSGGPRASDGSVRHGDFGCAVWIPPAEATAKGIPDCGTTINTLWGKGIASSETVPNSHPYYYDDAEAWTLKDEDIIGNGPFEFESWIKNVEAKVTRYEKYFVGVNPDNPSIVYDPILVQRLKKPTIEGIRFLVYRTTQLGVFALQSAAVDFYHWNVAAEFVPDLLKIPEIAVESNAEPGFFYMAYNFRRQPWGYVGGNPANGDTQMGYWLRQAFSHLIDKKSIVQNLLQNFGVIGHGTISPANTFWYNDNIPKPGFDLAQANAILDDMALPGGLIPQIPGFTVDPAGACTKDTDSGCRSMPTIGNREFEILTPQADYDPVRASAGAMVAD